MSRSRAGSLAAIFLVVFIDLLGFGIALPLLARYGEYFEAEAWLGSLVAVFSAMQLVFAPAWGRLSDRIGRRPVLLIGLAGSAACYAVFGLASGMEKGETFLGLSPLAWLFASRIGAGVSGATISTAQAYIADVTGPAERAKGMALIGAAFGAGFTFGPLLGVPFVGDEPGAPPSPYPGYLASGLSLAALTVCFALLKEPERRGAAGGEPAGRWRLLAEPVRLALFGEIFVTTAAFAMYESTLTLLSERLGYSESENYLLFAYIGITLVIAQGILVRRIPPRFVRGMVPAGLSLLACGLLALGWIASNPDMTGMILYAALGLCVVGVSFVSPSLQALLSLTTPGDRQGVVLGLGQSAAALARIAGPLVGIRLFQVSPATAYGVSAATVAVGLVAIVPVLVVLKRYESDAGAAAGAG